ncbi:hypothetical protein SEUBUCD646_0O03660 [Saccharomyces eubayanus]|uniref:NBL1-like protein n=1 Tax=Saccharomyces eubayanus TaxID=1080349 RepID=A0ABN8VIN6_SACEU|nr:hypothetical protein SEUBUCD650_0O03660 [Saccharomyces eubayanus]CAI1772032.1 hypothetical protein SEUBUCD646_0O03660 [Saccharomyces eubayanus]
MEPALSAEERQRLRSTVLRTIETTEQHIDAIKKHTLAKLDLLQQAPAVSASQQELLIRQVLQLERRRGE